MFDMEILKSKLMHNYSLYMQDGQRCYAGNVPPPIFLRSMVSCSMLLSKS